MLVLQSSDPSRTAQGMQKRFPSYLARWRAASSTAQSIRQLLGEPRHLLLDLDPFPFLSFPRSEQFVRQIERRQDRDAGRIGGRHVLGDLAHPAVHEIGELLEVPAVVAPTDVVLRAKDS